MEPSHTLDLTNYQIAAATSATAVTVASTTTNYMNDVSFVCIQQIENEFSELINKFRIPSGGGYELTDSVFYTRREQPNRSLSPLVSFSYIDLDKGVTIGGCRYIGRNHISDQEVVYIRDCFEIVKDQVKYEKLIKYCKQYTTCEIKMAHANISNNNKNIFMFFSGRRDAAYDDACDADRDDVRDDVRDNTHFNHNKFLHDYSVIVLNIMIYTIKYMYAYIPDHNIHHRQNFVNIIPTIP